MFLLLQYLTVKKKKKFCLKEQKKVDKARILQTLVRDDESGSSDWSPEMTGTWTFF